MATVKILSSKSNVGGLINYLKQEKKTSEMLQSGVDCSPENVKLEFKTTKELYKKTGGRQYYHLIQSFKPGEVTPEKAHDIGIEWAKKNFKGYQCFVVTHRDREHVHNHVVVNSVSLESGKKLQTSKTDLKEFKKDSDRICAREKLSVVQKKNRSYNMSQAEYKNATKGKSWKIELMKDIKSCITDKESINKIIFINKMQDKGYKVNWSDTRKYITFTTPDNKKCRDRKIPDIYSKENLIKVFTKNRELMQEEVVKMQKTTENKKIKTRPNELDEVINRKREELIKQKELEKEPPEVVKSEKMKEIESLENELAVMKSESVALESTINKKMEEYEKQKTKTVRAKHKIDNIEIEINRLSKGLGKFTNKAEIETLTGKKREAESVFNKLMSETSAMQLNGNKLLEEQKQLKGKILMKSSDIRYKKSNLERNERGISKKRYRDLGRGR